jgi:hypothetical protein
MRAPLVLAAALALSACGNNDQADNTINVDDSLTAENIVSNDVTAIDAVTGAAANMAADVDMNFGDLDVNDSAVATNQPAKKPTATAPRRSAPPPATESNTGAPAANTVTNSE